MSHQNLGNFEVFATTSDHLRVYRFNDESFAVADLKNNYQQEPAYQYQQSYAPPATYASSYGGYGSGYGGGNRVLSSAVLGAAGGFLGSQVGHGSGRAAATAAGAVAGWLLGGRLGQ